MDWIYGSRDHGWLSVHGGLVTMGRRSPLGLGGRRDCLEREREKGGHQNSHQWRHLEVELQRWPHDDAQKRRSVML
jgi:hypothetical protein